MGKNNKRKTPTKAEKQVRKARFQQKTKSQMNTYKNMQKVQYDKMLERENMIRRATIVEGILNARPEIAKEVDGKLMLNIDEVYLNEADQILYWTKDNNPVVSGLDMFENYPKYSPEFFNEIFEFIQNHKAQLAQQNTTDIDLSDFELVEDENFEIVNEISNNTSNIITVDIEENKNE